MAITWDGTVLCVQKLMEMYLLGGPLTASDREQLGVGQRCQMLLGCGCVNNSALNLGAQPVVAPL